MKRLNSKRFKNADVEEQKKMYLLSCSSLTLFLSLEAMKVSVLTYANNTA